MESHNRNLESVIASANDVIERRLVKHKQVAKALRDGAGAGADEILALAHAQIMLWEQGQLCSQDYIDAWKELLKNPFDAARVLEERSAHAAALRQNSPFVGSVRKFQVLTQKK